MNLFLFLTISYSIISNDKKFFKKLLINIIIIFVFMPFSISTTSFYHFGCPTNQIFVASYVGKNTIKIHCDDIKFCYVENDYRKKGIKCKYFEDEYACGGKTIFLSEIFKDSNDNRIYHTCCLNKNHAFYAINCHIHEIPEKKIKNFNFNDKSNEKSIEFTSSEEINLKSKIDFTVTDEEIESYQFFTIPFNRFKYQKKPRYVVKSVLKTNDSFKFTLCSISCFNKRKNYLRKNNYRSFYN
uniref:ZP domain-containing protein n=1 Tax=Strongyloides stercoralis TaxID=6248 RepID=A0A0K0DXM2_STRER